MVRKIFLISSFLLGFVLIFWGIYFFVFQKSGSPIAQVKNPNDEQKPSIVDETAQTPKNQKIKPLTATAVTNPSIEKTGDTIRYFSQDTNTPFQINADGQEKKVLSDAPLPPFVFALWSPDGSKVILKTSGSDNPRYSLFVPALGQTTSLKPGIQFVAWNSMSDKILYTYKDAAGKITLDSANPDGSDWKTLAHPERAETSIAAIPGSPLVSYWDKPANLTASALHITSLTGSDDRTVFNGRFGADFLWSPQGDMALVSTSEQKNGPKMALATINANGAGYQNLNFSTLVTKCVWSRDNTHVFCAVPGNIPATAVMPDDYRAGKVKTADTFWKIDTKTAKSERAVELSDLDQSYDAGSLMLTPSEDALIFQNRTDGKLYRIDL